ncbi:MAG: IS701 family transposase, partial [Actinobacteria bacterium]|nr:IS701 family transposase [Actinomycetota bacterium]
EEGMMAQMAAATDVDTPVEVKERLEAFAAEVLAEAINRPVQMVNGGLYLRGLIEQAPRKSLEPLVERLGDEADYQSLQQFVADSPWDPAVVVRAVCERVAPLIDVEAWVLDDTGFVKDGRDSPGVKRQYSGTLGKIGNCQIGVSVHAVGERGTVPLGFALYLPEEWCADPERRRRAKVPEKVSFKTKPELGVELVERAAGWELGAAPVLGDQAYGDNTELRERLHRARREYVLSVGAATTVFAPETKFSVPERTGERGRPQSRPRPDREPEAIEALVARLGEEQWRTVSFRDGPDGEPHSSRFCFLGVRAANRSDKRTPWPPREEWLIAEWPAGRGGPTDYWISNLPSDTEPERLARLARLRWKIELDYKQLKGELGLDHYEGRSWLGWHHHTALVTAAHGFLTLERQSPNRPRPA